MGEGCREGGGVLFFYGFHTVFYCFLQLLPFSEWDFFSFLFSLSLTGESVYFSSYLFLITFLPFLKCSTKWGIPIFFRTVKRIFGGERKYLVYVCLPIKRCTIQDNCWIGGLFFFGGGFSFFLSLTIVRPVYELSHVIYDTRNKHQKTHLH